MPTSILELVLKRLDEPRTRFVFPSEVAASSVLAAALAASGRKALPSSRFIGWDAFKSEVFAGERRGRPSSSAIRAVFSRMLAQENARSPFLSSVIPMKAAPSSRRFARSIAAALPALRSVPEGPGDHLADWRELRRRYEAFMADRGLYEAAWLGREAAGSGADWVLVYPDLTEDWADYAEATLAIPGTSAILAGEPSGTVPAARFGTVVEELRAVLLAVRAAVDAGADPAGIAISAASPESVLPILEREAAVAGVPLDVREGRPLSESSGGRLLADIVGLASGGMSFDDLRRFLLDASRPLKERGAARRLLAVGIDRHLIARLPGTADVWEACLGEDDGARRLYRGLRTASAKLASAPGFRSLRLAYDAFRRAFIDEDAWSQAQDDEIARCLAVLDELEEAAEAAGLPPDAAPGAAETWLSMLADTRYLPVSQSGGIAVYRFPVAAGALPDLHFVVNLAQGAATAAARPLSFIRADVRDRLGASDRDLSAGLVRLLAESGRRVFLSYSEDGPDGVRPPHPAIEPRPPELVGLFYDRDAWLPNLEAEGRPVSEAFPLQAVSARAGAATALGGRGSRWTDGEPGAPETMGQECSGRVLSALSASGALGLSATTIEEYARCAFYRVFRRALRVEAAETGLSFVDDLVLGRVYHDAFRRLLSPLAAAGLSIVAPLDAAAGETARPGAVDSERAMTEAIAALEAEKGPMAGALVGLAAPVLRRCFSRAAATLLEALDGFVPVMVDDKELYAPLPAIDAELRGRPDLVCVSASDADRRRAVIVDYKKSKVPAKASLAPADDGSVSDVQIPAYLALSKAAGLEPEAAYYLSIEGAAPGGKGLLLVFGPGAKPAIPADRLHLLEPALEAAAAAAAALIRSGSVFVPARRDREAACEGCDLRPVCRIHYAVR